MAEPRDGHGDREGAVVEVRWSGELKNVMMNGDLRGTIELESLATLPHVYAVGALEGLQGEVTILDSSVSIAVVEDGKVVVSELQEGKACTLVFAQVRQWKEWPLPKSTESLHHLESFLVEAATKEGIDVSRPFPFLVKGKVAEANYHVLRHPGDLEDPHDLHDKAQVEYVLKNSSVELLGFYSDKHMGIFTCGGNLHVHLRSGDGKTSGHLDAVALGDNMRLFLPATASK
jgi:acetolactate decarboxylase